MLRLYTLVSLVIIASPFQARAETFEFGGMSYTLDLPAPYCAYNTDNLFEGEFARIMQQMQGAQNTVLLIFQDCAELEAIQMGVSDQVNNYGMVLEQLNAATGEAVVVPGTSTKEFVDLIEGELANGGIPDVRSIVQNRLDDALEDTGVTSLISSASVGIYDRSDKALYLAIAANVDTDNESDAVAGITALTLAKARSISFNFYTPYESDASYAALQKVAAGMVDEFLVSNRLALKEKTPNPNTGPAQLPTGVAELPLSEKKWLGINWSDVGMAGLRGAGIGFVVTAGYMGFKAWRKSKS